MGEESKLEVGKDLVTLAQASQNLAESSIGRQDWSGLPIPVPGLRLVLEPRYKHNATTKTASAMKSLKSRRLRRPGSEESIPGGVTDTK
jgi:hypothetical protein